MERLTCLMGIATWMLYTIGKWWRRFYHKNCCGNCYLNQHMDIEDSASLQFTTGSTGRVFSSLQPVSSSGRSSFNTGTGWLHLPLLPDSNYQLHIHKMEWKITYNQETRTSLYTFQGYFFLLILKTAGRFVAQRIPENTHSVYAFPVTRRASDIQWIILQV